MKNRNGRRRKPTSFDSSIRALDTATRQVQAWLGASPLHKRPKGISLKKFAGFLTGTGRLLHV